MKRLTLFLLLLWATGAFGQCTGGSSPNWTWTLSANLSSGTNNLQGCVNQTVDGDKITISVGSTTWSGTGVSWSGKGITITGTGTPSNSPSVTGPDASCTATSITWTTTSGNRIFNVTPSLTSSLTRISCMSINTTGATGNFPYPIYVNGTCNTSGCPNLRLDNITVPNGNMCNVADASFFGVNDMFGVADHNAVGQIPFLTCNGPVLANVGYGTWQGIGPWGDNSWATPDTFGTKQAFYLENNNFSGHGMGTDMDFFPGNGDFGGGRAVCRFNTFNGISPGGTCVDHGTDTIGRVRGGRQIEFYKNSLNCSGTCQGSVWGARSAAAIIWGNTLTSGNVGSWASVNTQRTWRKNSVFGSCDGSAPWDQNDATVYDSGTISSAAGLGYSVTNGVTTGALSGGGSGFTINITSVDAAGGITGATIGSGGANYAVGNILQVNGPTVNNQAAIRVTAVSGGAVTIYVLGSFPARDTTKSWAVNTWAASGGFAYSFHDVTANYGFQIASNTATALIAKISCNQAGCTERDESGDSYQILHAISCMDQPGRGQGQLIVGGDCNTFPTGGHLCPQLVSTGNTGPIANALDPIYELNDVGTVNNFQFSSSDSQSLIANRDYYAQNIGQTAQTTSSSPFTGNPGTGPGVGWGTIGNRPSTCTTGVSYWATDQGTWNTSGSGGQGVLYICGATGWPSSPSYTPFIYPHTLISAPPIATFTPSPVNIGLVPLGLTSNPISVTLQNTGTITLTNTSITLSSALFTIKSNTCGSPATITSLIPGTGFSLVAGASCTFQVVVSPTVTGTVTANVVFAENTGTGSDTLVLNANGTGPPAPTTIMFAGKFATHTLCPIESNATQLCFANDCNCWWLSMDGAAYAPFGVSSVNGKTGNVALSIQ